MYWVIGVSIIFMLIYLYFKRCFSFWKDRGFYYVEPSIPLGNFTSIGFKEHLCEFMKREYDNFKDKAPAFGIYLLTNPGIVITDPDLIKEVCSTSFEHFDQRGIYVNEKADPLWKNIYTASGKEWQDLRAKLSPTFTSVQTKMIFPIVAEAADRLVDYFKFEEITHECLEMKEIFGSYTTEVIANTAFGLDIKCLGNPDNEFKQIAKNLFEPPKLKNLENLVIFTFPKIAKFFNLGINSKHVIDFFMGTVRKNMEYREKNNIRRNDFFQLLIDLKNSDVGMSFNEISANSFIFFTVGFEVSSCVMSFMSYELALNQDIQDRLRQEIEEIIKGYNGEVTYDAITAMKYLDMVFNETLRKYPVVETHCRESSKDFKIPNTNLVIPSGVAVLIPSFALHYDEKYFKNPDVFDPNRFSDENAKKIVPHTFLPFSEGHRKCMGQSFGTMQVKIGIVKLLKNFKIHSCSKTLIPMKFTPNFGFQAPHGGMWLKIKPLK